MLNVCSVVVPRCLFLPELGEGRVCGTLGVQRCAGLPSGCALQPAGRQAEQGMLLLVIPIRVAHLTQVVCCCCSPMPRLRPSKHPKCVSSPRSRWPWSPRTWPLNRGLSRRRYGVVVGPTVSLYCTSRADELAVAFAQAELSALVWNHPLCRKLVHNTNKTGLDYWTR